MAEKTAAEMAAALAELLHKKLGVKESNLETMIGRAGRLLPKNIQRLALRIAQAETRAENPKLARRNNPAELARSFKQVEKFLLKVDTADRRKGALLGIFGSIALSLLGTFVLVVAFMIWKGLL